MASAVGDVVHRHDGCGAERGGAGLLAQVLAGLLGDLHEHGLVAGGGGRGQEGAPLLLLGQRRGAGQGGQVEGQVLGPVRQG